MESAASHVQCFDLMRRSIADGFEITVTDQEVILDDAAEWCQRKDDAAMRRPVFERDIEREPVFFHRKNKPVRAAFRTARRKAVRFEKIVDRDFALLLDLPRPPHERALV